MTMEIVTQQYNELAAPQVGRGLDENPAFVYINSLGSKVSRATMRDALNSIFDLLLPDYMERPDRPRKSDYPDPDQWQAARDKWAAEREVYNNRYLIPNWAALRPQHAEMIRARLTEEYKPESVRKMLSALRGVLKKAWKLGQVSGEEYHRTADIDRVIGETLPAGRHISTGEFTAVMAACNADPRPAGARDGAIIALAYSTGLRRAEIVSLDLANYDPQTGKLVIVGKRRKERTAYLVNGARAAMDDWLIVRGSEPGPLFVPINKGNNLQYGRHLTNQAFYTMLSKRAEQAGAGKCSPHDLRRTFVTDMLEAGADALIVSKMAGHSNVQTTARYDRRPEQAKQKAAELLHVPYTRRVMAG